MLLPGIIVTLSYFSESIFGFGGGLIAIPLIGILGSVKDAVLYVLVFQLAMGVVTYKNLQHADWKILKRMGIGIFIGVILGSLNLIIADEQVLRKILGITVILVLIKSLFFPKLTIKPGSKLIETGVGIVGGYLQGVIGTGSPVFSMYLINIEVSKQVFRSTLMIIFFSTSIYRFLFSFGFQPGFSSIVISAFPIVPFFIAATLLGNRLAGKINDTYFKYFVYFLNFLTSLSLLLKD